MTHCTDAEGPKRRQRDPGQDIQDTTRMIPSNMRDGCNTMRNRKKKGGRTSREMRKRKGNETEK